MNIFEYAAKTKVRFSTPKGEFSAEDLYDLPLTKLNELWQKLKQEQAAVTAPSLMDSSRSAKTVDLDTKIALIEHVFQQRKEEAQAVKERAEKRQAAQNRLATLEAIAAQKEFEQLGAQSLDDIRKMIEEAKSALA